MAAPTLEKEAGESLWSTAPTAITLLMQPGAVSPCVPRFPAELTTVTPAETALLIAVVRLGIQLSQLGSVPPLSAAERLPMLMLMTWAPFVTAQSIPAMSWEKVP
jgi:hypothetical protein